MAYGDSGEILNTLKFKLATSSYNWGPFLSGDGILPSGAFPVNQGTDSDSIWAFDNNYYWPISVTASSTHGLPNAGIENSNTSVEMINTEIYVKAQLFIVNTVTNAAGATLTIPITGLNTVDGAAINVPYATWQPLQATGQQHKIVLRAYVAHFKYRKGCWSGGNHAARVNESTINAATPTGPGTSDWEKGWVASGSPVIATWSGSQLLYIFSDGMSQCYYDSSSISMNATLEAILPGHPVNGAATNVITTPGFSLYESLRVNVNWATVNVAAGVFHSLGLRSDGTVVAVGINNAGQCNVSGWTNIIVVAAGNAHSLGLRSNGTVVATGNNGSGQLNVSGWSNIVAVAARSSYSLGLKSDGTVEAVGWNLDGQLNVGGWTNIIAVAAGIYHSLGLRSDGTVEAVGNNTDGQCDVDGWTNIIAIATAHVHSLGLKSNGRVEAVGNNADGRCDVSGWTNIIAISAGAQHSLGLKSDGTVVAVGNNPYGQCNVGSWTNIIAVAAGGYHSLGLKSDGTVVAVGQNTYGQLNVGSWDLIP